LVPVRADQIKCWEITIFRNVVLFKYSIISFYTFFIEERIDLAPSSNVKEKATTGRPMTIKDRTFARFIISSFKISLIKVGEYLIPS